jgi:hypothetical protein
LPAALSHADYPGMVGAGQDVNTIAVSAVLIAYNWPKDSDRYRRIANFIDVFFPKLAELQKPPHHPKWRETNLAAVVPGWTRFPEAVDWLERNREKQSAIMTDAGSTSQPSLATERPHNVGGAPQDSAAHDQLFEEFVNWRSRQH